MLSGRPADEQRMDQRESRVVSILTQTGVGIGIAVKAGAVPLVVGVQFLGEEAGRLVK